MKFGYTINNKLITNAAGSLLTTDPYNYLNLPPNTFRVRTNDGQEPISGNYDSATLVEGTTDVYDVYKGGYNLGNILFASKNVIEVLGANTENVTGMGYWFHQSSQCLAK